MIVLEPPARPMRRLARIVGACGVAMAALVALRVVAQRAADRRWAVTEARLHAAGVSTDLHDFDHPPIADTDNAAIDLTAAFAGLSSGAIVNPAISAGPRSSPYEMTAFGTYPPYNALWLNLASGAESAALPSMRLTRDARRRPRIDWGAPIPSPTAQRLFPALNGARSLANTLADGAELSFVRGDDREGIERIRDLLFLARAQTADDRSALITALVRVGIDAVTCAALDPHIGAITIDDAADGTHATRVQVRALIDELLNSDIELAVRRSLKTETTLMMTLAATAADDAWMMRTVIVADRARLGERLLVVLAAIDAPNNATRAATLASLPNYQAFGRMLSIWGWRRPLSPMPHFGAPLTQVVSGSYDRMLQTVARVRVAQHLTAIMLAMRLYELDHGGRWPASLVELVPAYLPFIPRDPLSPIDSPYMYGFEPAGLPDGRDRPLLAHSGGMPRGPVSNQPTTRPLVGLSGEPIYGGDGYRVSDLTSWIPVPTTQPTSQPTP